MSRLITMMYLTILVTLAEVPTNTTVPDIPIVSQDARRAYLEEIVFPTVLVDSSANENGSSGSGVLIKGKYVLTAKHVVIACEESCRITITEGGIQKVYKSKVVKKSEDQDYAILELLIDKPDRIYKTLYNGLIGEGIHIYSAKLPSEETLDNMCPGTEIISVGHPGHCLHSKITTGVISEMEDGFGCSSAPIIYGNSGGPVYTKDTHELVGINVAIAMLNPFSPVFHLARYVSISDIMDDINELD